MCAGRTAGHIHQIRVNLINLGPVARGSRLRGGSLLGRIQRRELAKDFKRLSVRHSTLAGVVGAEGKEIPPTLKCLGVKAMKSNQKFHLIRATTGTPGGVSVQ